MNNLVILTGPSGSGRSSARFVFEELGYFVCENVPSDVVDPLIDSFSKRVKYCQNFALIVSVRDAKKVLECAQKHADFHVSLIVLITDKKELLKRFTLTRHVHPRTLIEKTTLHKAIDADIASVKELINDADLFVDTTNLTVKDLRLRLYGYLDGRENSGTHFHIVSFGLKNVTPNDIDLLFDVRIIPNPYWVEEYRSLSGLDKPVVDYMESFPITQQIREHIVSYLEFYMQKVIEAGRASYSIGIACSGGQHRSVYIAQYLYNHFADKYKVSVSHRDIDRIEERDFKRNG